MNEYAKKWVEALRSGKYGQTTGILHNPDTGGYCCLGVMVEVAREMGHDFDIDRHYPEHRAVALFGLTTDMGTYDDGWDTFGSLVKLNDTGATFEEIADFIESEPPGLFR